LATAFRKISSPHVAAAAGGGGGSFTAAFGQGFDVEGLRNVAIVVNRLGAGGSMCVFFLGFWSGLEWQV
jgi:hypothetical protein